MKKEKKSEKIETLELVEKLDEKQKEKKEIKVVKEGKVQKVKKEKKERKKINIDFKGILKSILRYILSHKIFTILNILFLAVIVFAFTKKVLFGLVMIVLWLLFIIAHRIIGGKLKVDKKNMSEEDMKKYKRKKRRLLKWLFNFILLMILLALIGAIVFAIYIVINAPDFDPDNLYRAESSIIYDRDGNQIAKIGLEKRKKVTYDDLPQVLVDAIVATEDSRYYQHNGFDLPRFTKAAAGQVINKVTGHGNAGGGSTISMQVVKNNFTDTEQTLTRKLTRKELF